MPIFGRKESGSRTSIAHKCALASGFASQRFRWFAGSQPNERSAENRTPASGFASHCFQWFAGVPFSRPAVRNASDSGRSPWRNRLFHTASSSHKGSPMNALFPAISTCLWKLTQKFIQQVKIRPARRLLLRPENAHICPKSVFSFHNKSLFNSICAASNSCTPPMLFRAQLFPDVSQCLSPPPVLNCFPHGKNHKIILELLQRP